MNRLPDAKRVPARRRQVRHVGLYLALLPAVTLATPADWQAGATHVRELVQAELRGPVEPAPVSAARPAPAPPRLVALYGTAGHYTVILDVDGVRKEYRPGASLPYGGQGGATEYRLVRLIDTCVVLRRGAQGRLRTACYVPQPAPVLAPAPGSPAAAAAGDVLSSPLPLAGAGGLP